MPLFTDDRLLALDKPAGVSMATSARISESETVGRLLEACGLPREPSLRIVHRLDVGTSGVVLLARNAEAHRLLTRAFQERAAKKTYRALCWGHPVPARGVLDAPLGRDTKDGRKMAVRPEGKPARTGYATLRRYAGIADLELAPETGRTHQIRVHLAAKGHPIVGDDFYGGATRWRGVRDPALRAALARVAHPLLHALRVEIPEMGIDVTAPLPAEYRRILEMLGGEVQSARKE